MFLRMLPVELGVGSKVDLSKKIHLHSVDEDGGS
jgi:hypothetical protein